MTALELQAKKAELAKGILNLESEEIINKLSNFYESLVADFPCQYTKEEVIYTIDEAIEAFDKGEKTRFKSFGEIKRKYTPV